MVEGYDCNVINSVDDNGKTFGSLEHQKYAVLHEFLELALHSVL